MGPGPVGDGAATSLAMPLHVGMDPGLSFDGGIPTRRRVSAPVPAVRTVRRRESDISCLPLFSMLTAAFTSVWNSARQLVHPGGEWAGGASNGTGVGPGDTGAVFGRGC